MKNTKKSIRFRLMVLVTGLILFVFVMVSITFNILITKYIESNATEVLTQARQMATSGSDKPDRNPAGKSETVILTEDYRILFPEWIPSGFNGESDLEVFVEGLKDENGELASDQIERIETGENLYYYTSIKISGFDEGYGVFFINMTNLFIFQKNLSRILWAVLLIALVATVFLTSIISLRITEPIKTISRHAKLIGEGKYKSIEEDFSDLELDQLKSSLNETTKKLEKYDEDQKVFFQNVSHELRTPLQIIKNNAEGIGYGLLDSKKATEIIKDETDHLGELVEDMIYLSRLESGSKDMVFTENDMREILSYTLERFRNIFERKGIRVIYDFSEEPVWFACEEKSLERAFVNLTSNALRYAKSKVSVACKLTEGRILISISDDGHGISEEDLPNIFNRFYKGEKGVHGIGLSIVQSVVYSHGGRIEVKTGDEGAAFTIIFDKT
ncbi:sensor histidine kinase [Alkalibacter mobilis]|uniref:sensor histidine kinase n=1 Tax=Alkalibacter mobilis TaxID=2787712 RepID=UPI00189C5AF8|nr:HAMP domain-containing sensor histidine kinase [Alkalibacter mobilis]MBF7096625.1 HAMP domain-containing histidine kinase [Alkalibacter mobilis]